MSPSFVLFGTPHLLALATSFMLPLAAAVAIQPWTRPHFDRIVRWSLASLMTANWLAWMLLLYEKGWLTIGNELPLNLCDWATAATIVTLAYPNQRSYELAYFWALAGTLQGMLTPDLKSDFPDIEFILFFVFHGGIIASVLYMTFGLGWRPAPASLPRVIAWSLSYALVAAGVDWLTGANYGFLRAKPPFPTVFDFMPDWPWYVPLLVLLGLMSTAIYYAPFLVWDKVRQVRSRHVETVRYS